MSVLTKLNQPISLRKRPTAGSAEGSSAPGVAGETFAPDGGATAPDAGRSGGSSGGSPSRKAKGRATGKGNAKGKASGSRSKATSSGAHSKAGAKSGRGTGASRSFGRRAKPSSGPAVRLGTSGAKRSITVTPEVKRLFAIAAAPVLVLSVAWWFFVLRPRSDVVTTAQNDVAQAQAEVARARAELERARQAATDESATRKRIDAAVAAVPATTDVGGFLVQLDGAAKAAGVTLVNVVPSRPTSADPTGAPAQANGAAAAIAASATSSTAAGRSEGGSASPSTSVAPAPTGLVSVSIDLTARGQQPRLIDYLRRVEGLPRIAIVDRLQFAAQDGGQGVAIMTLRIFAKGP